MTMVIECEACRSRFRLDEGLFKGARAIRVRCRKCGGPIVALNPDLPEMLYAEEDAPAERPAPAEAPREDAAPAQAALPLEEAPPEEAAVPTPGMSTADDASIGDEPRDEVAERADEAFSGEEAPPTEDVAPVAEARRETGEGASEAPPEPPPFWLEEETPLRLDPPAAEPLRAETEGSADVQAKDEAFSAILDDLLSSLPDDPPKPAGSERPGLSRAEEQALLSELAKPEPSDLYPAPPEGTETVITALEDLFAPAPTVDTALRGAPFEEDRRRRYTPPPPAPMPSPERPPYMRPLFLVGVAVWLLLLAGGALFFGTGGTPGRSLLPSSGGAGPSPAVGGEYDIRDVKWETVRKTDAGDLFVVRGTVVNAGSKESGGIRIQATLLGTDNEALGERDVFAGNVIDDTTLRHASQTVLKGVLNKRFGDGERNRDIAPGASLPFMVVFFDPPADIGSILVKGVDAP